MRIRVLCLALCTVSVLLLSPAADATGHGPVFGFATPVNSQGEWSFDIGVLDRNASVGSQVAARSMASYGVTPQLQFSLIAPGMLQAGSLPMTTMPSGGDFQTNLAWRFHHRPYAVGTRFESTASVGIVVPTGLDNFAMFRGSHTAPGVNAWVATGIASRAHYLWLGGGLTRFAEHRGDRRPGVYSTTLVYGYRPPAWRSDRHVWDWRIFVEASAEHSGLIERRSMFMPGSAANQIFVGPTTLGIYKTFAISGGVQFPVYRNNGALYPAEHIRAAINLTYFLFSHSH